MQRQYREKGKSLFLSISVDIRMKCYAAYRAHGAQEAILVVIYVAI